MTKKELFDKNLELSSEFSRYILVNPEIAEKLPPESEILFIVDSDPELTQYNLELAEKLKRENQQPVFVHIKALLPKETSRLVEPKIEYTAR